MSASVSSGFKCSLRDACMYDESRPTGCKQIPASHFPERFGSPRTVNRNSPVTTGQHDCKLQFDCTYV